MPVQDKRTRCSESNSHCCVPSSSPIDSRCVASATFRQRSSASRSCRSYFPRNRCRRRSSIRFRVAWRSATTSTSPDSSTRRPRARQSSAARSRRRWTIWREPPAPRRGRRMPSRRTSSCGFAAGRGLAATGVSLAGRGAEHGDVQAQATLDSLDTATNLAVSSLTPALITLDEATLARYENERPDLRRYHFRIVTTRRRTGHVLTWAPDLSNPAGGVLNGGRQPEREPTLEVAAQLDVGTQRQGSLSRARQ